MWRWKIVVHRETLQRGFPIFSFLCNMSIYSMCLQLLRFKLPISFPVHIRVLFLVARAALIFFFRETLERNPTQTRRRELSLTLSGIEQRPEDLERSKRGGFFVWLWIRWWLLHSRARRTERALSNVHYTKFLASAFCLCITLFFVHAAQLLRLRRYGDPFFLCYYFECSQPIGCLV